MATFTIYLRKPFYTLETAWLYQCVSETPELQLGGKRGITADIYCVRMYSRAPSAAEIATTYAIEERRFDL